MNPIHEFRGYTGKAGRSEKVKPVTGNPLGHSDNWRDDCHSMDTSGEYEEYYRRQREKKQAWRKYQYSNGRKCGKCGKPILNKAKTDYCMECVPPATYRGKKKRNGK